jgi:hypothetical protein
MFDVSRRTVHQYAAASETGNQTKFALHAKKQRAEQLLHQQLAQAGKESSYTNEYIDEQSLCFNHRVKPDARISDRQGKPHALRAEQKNLEREFICTSG